MTTKTDITQERADFEAAYAATFPTAAGRPDKFDQEAWGEYRDAYVVVGWRMWQAGRAAVEADRQGRMPSDTEIQQVMAEHGRPNDGAGTMTYTSEQIAAAGRDLLQQFFDALDDALSKERASPWTGVKREKFRDRMLAWDRVQELRGQLLAAPAVAQAQPSGNSRELPSGFNATIKRALVLLHDSGVDQDKCDAALNWLTKPRTAQGLEGLPPLPLTSGWEPGCPYPDWVNNLLVDYARSALAARASLTPDMQRADKRGSESAREAKDQS